MIPTTVTECLERIKQLDEEKYNQIMSKVTVVQDKDNPIATEIIAQAIVDISAAMKKMNDSRLTRRAIIALVREQMSQPVLSKRDINRVIECLSDLEHEFIKKKN